MGLEAPRAAGGVETRGGRSRGPQCSMGDTNARLAVAGAGVCRRCDAVGAVKTAEVTGARGCSAAWATKVAGLAVAGAGVCRRCDAVGAVKTAEVHGARAESLP